MFIDNVVAEQVPTVLSASPSNISVPWTSKHMPQCTINDMVQPSIPSNKGRKCSDTLQRNCFKVINNEFKFFIDAAKPNAQPINIQGFAGSYTLKMIKKLGAMGGTIVRTYTPSIAVIEETLALIQQSGYGDQIYLWVRYNSIEFNEFIEFIEFIYGHHGHHDIRCSHCDKNVTNVYNTNLAHLFLYSFASLMFDVSGWIDCARGEEQ
jgi:hypothetical protein